MDLEDQLTRIVEMKEFGKYGDENREFVGWWKNLLGAKYFARSKRIYVAGTTELSLLMNLIVHEKTIGLLSCDIDQIAW